MVGPLADENDMDDDFQRPPQRETRPLRHFALMAAVFEGGLVAVAMGLGWLVGQDPLQSFRWSLADAGWGLVATLPLLALLWLCLKCPLGPMKHMVQVVDELLVPLFRDCRILDLAVISALAGLSEEMLFRGVIQQTVADRMSAEAGMWIGLAVAAILFGLAHRVTNTYAIFAGLIGLYLGAVWLMSGNLLVPVTAHALYDFLALLYLAKIRRTPTASI